MKKFDVEFNGHIIVEANSPDEACDIAQKILDDTEAYCYVENAEIY